MAQEPTRDPPTAAGSGVTPMQRPTADMIPQDTDLSLSLRITAALDQGQLQLARTGLADAEASKAIPSLDAALLRAQIAQAQGDLVAARAILVMAVETLPNPISARRALAEVMIAMGSAADVRAVLKHLAQHPCKDSPGADVSCDSVR